MFHKNIARRLGRVDSHVVVGNNGTTLRRDFKLVWCDFRSQIESIFQIQSCYLVSRKFQNGSEWSSLRDLDDLHHKMRCVINMYGRKQCCRKKTNLIWKLRV